MTRIYRVRLVIILYYSDTPRPVERDGLLSNGGSMTVFPKKPYSVGGCTIYLTQTTEYQSTQGRACPTTTSQKRTSGCVDTFGESLVGDSSPRTFSFHQRRSGQVRALLRRGGILTLAMFTGGAGQRARTVPDAAQTPWLSASALRVYSHTRQGNRKHPGTPAPDKERRFHPNPPLGDGTSRAGH